jgi:hypothetical protein
MVLDAAALSEDESWLFLEDQPVLLFPLAPHSVRWAAYK